jgi:osmotically-inducible protein OsmY
MSTDAELYDEATKVTAKNGEVILDGPDGVDVKLTPEAAQQTSDNLMEGAARAAGQRKLKDLPHSPY